MKVKNTVFLTVTSLLNGIAPIGFQNDILSGNSFYKKIDDIMYKAHN